MLYSLAYPFSFAVLVVAFVVGLWVRGASQRLVSGDRRPAWARRATRRRDFMWLRPFVDPYGALAALISGSGWGAPVDLTATRGRGSSRTVARLLAGPVSVFALGVVALAAFRSWAGLAVTTADWPFALFEGGAGLATGHFHYVLGYGQIALLLAGGEWVAMGLIAILPIPPLDGGKLLFHLAPRSIGWQRARYRLDDESWGALILLVLSLPVIFPRPPILTFVGHVLAPLMRAIS